MGERSSPSPVALPSSIRLTQAEGGLSRLDVATAACTGAVYLQGAHITSWQPSHAADPVLWLSRQSLFARGKPIRGGIPVCFPWFGPHPEAADAPPHGFARIAAWTLGEAREAADGTVHLSLVLESGVATSPAWPHAYQLVHRITMGSRLVSTLEVRNPGSEPFTFEEALHTYFAVRDIEGVTVSGLEGAEYLDKVEGFARRRQGDQPVRFTGETDRLYVNTTAACEIHDAGMRRRIVVSKSRSRSTVVWNPWIDKARALPDFGDDEWRLMVCVETANAGANHVPLQPGETHRMTAELAVEPA